MFRSSSAGRWCQWPSCHRIRIGLWLVASIASHRHRRKNSTSSQVGLPARGRPYQVQGLWFSKCTSSACKWRGHRFLFVGFPAWTQDEVEPDAQSKPRHENGEEQGLAECVARERLHVVRECYGMHCEPLPQPERAKPITHRGVHLEPYSCAACCTSSFRTTDARCHGTITCCCPVQGRIAVLEDKQRITSLWRSSVGGVAARLGPSVEHLGSGPEHRQAAGEDPDPTGPKLHRLAVLPIRPPIPGIPLYTTQMRR